MFKKFIFNGKVLYSVKECLNVFINLLILDFISIPFFISGPNNSKKLLSDGSSLKTFYASWHTKPPNTIELNDFAFR